MEKSVCIKNLKGFMTKPLGTVKLYTRGNAHIKMGNHRNEFALKIRDSLKSRRVTASLVTVHLFHG